MKILCNENEEEMAEEGTEIIIYDERGDEKERDDDEGKEDDDDDKEDADDEDSDDEDQEDDDDDKEDVDDEDYEYQGEDHEDDDDDVFSQPTSRRRKQSLSETKKICLNSSDGESSSVKNSKSSDEEKYLLETLSSLDYVRVVKYLLTAANFEFNEYCSMSIF